MVGLFAQVHRVASADPALRGLRVAYGPAGQLGPVFRLPAVRVVRAGVRLADGGVLALETADGRLDASAIARTDAREIQVMLHAPEVDLRVTRVLQVALLGTDLESATLVEPAPVSWALRLAPVAPEKGTRGMLWRASWAEVEVPWVGRAADRFVRIPLDEALRRRVGEDAGRALRLDLQVAYEASGLGGSVSGFSGWRFRSPWLGIVPCVPPPMGRAWLDEIARGMTSSLWRAREIDPTWGHEAIVKPYLDRAIRERSPTAVWKEQGGQQGRLNLLVDRRLWIRTGFSRLVAWADREPGERRGELRRCLEQPESNASADDCAWVRIDAREDPPWFRMSTEEREALLLRIDACLARAGADLRSRSEASWASVTEEDAWELPFLPYDDSRIRATGGPVRALAWVPLLGE